MQHNTVACGVGQRQSCGPESVIQVLLPAVIAAVLVAACVAGVAACANCAASHHGSKSRWRDWHWSCCSWHVCFAVAAAIVIDISVLVVSVIAAEVTVGGW